MIRAKFTCQQNILNHETQTAEVIFTPVTTNNSITALTAVNDSQDTAIGLKLTNPTTTKTTVDNSDLIIGIDGNETPFRVTKANLLTGLSVGGEGSYPEEFTHFHDQSTVTTGNALAFTASASYVHGFVSYQNPPAINNSFKFKKSLKAGTYTLKLLGSVGNVYGILSLSINGVLQFTDWSLYSTSNTNNVVLSKTVTITSDGRQEFIFTVASKNVASSNYFASITKFWCTKN
jgi:hypothetical protein